MPSAGSSHCHGRSRCRRRRAAGPHVRERRQVAALDEGLRDGAHAVTSGSGSTASAPLACSASRTCVTSSKKRGSSRVSNVRGWVEIDGHDRGDPTGPWRHHDDPRRQVDGLRDRVGHEDHRRAGLRPDAKKLRVHPLSRHLVERPERLVHQEQCRREGERPRDRDALLHPARELPRIVLLEPLELDELQHVGHPLVSLRTAPTE